LRCECWHMGIGQNDRHFHEQNRRFQSISWDGRFYHLLSHTPHWVQIRLGCFTLTFPRGSMKATATLAARLWQNCWAGTKICRRWLIPRGKLLCTGPLGWKHPKLRTNPIEVAKKESFYLQCILFANTIYDYI
jgi:hypothetical protein